MAKKPRSMPPRVDTIYLKRRRIYIVPSWHGIIFSLFLLVMLLGALNYSNSVAFLLTFLLISVALVSMLHTYRNMAQLVIRVGKSMPVFAGQTAFFQVALENLSSWQRYALALQVHRQAETVQWVDLAPGECQWVNLPVPAKTRGWLAIPELRVWTRYPLGLFYAWSPCWLTATCLVYPKPAGLLTLPPLTPYHAAEQGDKGCGTDDFMGFRVYHPGDSPRQINWKAVAREQVLLTKQFGGDRVEEQWLDWATLPPIMTTEARLSQLTQWVLAASAQSLRYGLKLPGITLKPSQAGTHQQNCLQALALYAEK